MCLKMSFDPGGLRGSSRPLTPARNQWQVVLGNASSLALIERQIDKISSRMGTEQLTAPPASCPSTSIRRKLSVEKNAVNNAGEIGFQCHGSVCFRIAQSEFGLSF